MILEDLAVAVIAEDFLTGVRWQAGGASC